VAGPDPTRNEVTDANFSVLERAGTSWQAVADVSKRAMAGVGIGNYAVAYPAYSLPHWYEPLVMRTTFSV